MKLVTIESPDSPVMDEVFGSLGLTDTGVGEALYVLREVLAEQGYWVADQHYPEAGVTVLEVEGPFGEEGTLVIRRQ